MEIEDSSNEGLWAIFDATALARRGLESCLSIASLTHNEWAENRLMDFNLWASGVGASAKPPANLDQRLESQPDVRAVILGLLSTLAAFVDVCLKLGSDGSRTKYDQETHSPENMDDLGDLLDGLSTDQSDPFPSWSDESSASSGVDTEPPSSSISPIEQSKKDVESILDQIIRIGTLIRSAGTASRLRKADSYFMFVDFTNLSNTNYQHSNKLATKDLLELRVHLLVSLFINPSRYHSMPARNVQFDFEPDLNKLEPSHREVLERLIFANLRRRNRFWYARKHARKLLAAQTILFPEQKEAQITEPDLPSKRLPSSENQNPWPLKLGTLSTITGTAPSEGQIELRHLKPMGPQQQSMSRASVSLKKSGWPYPPKVPDERKTFRCPCCYLTLSSLEADRWHWRKHLSADICPYTCLFPGCSMESPLFVTRDEWKAHLQLDHKTSDYWECFACTDADNAIIFSTPDEFLGHMQGEHENLSDVDASRLLEICVRSNPISVKMCPLCVLEPQPKDMDPDVLLDHICDHMHDFALQSLPWLDVPENTNSKNLTDQTVRKITKWFNEVVPDADLAEEQYPAYPSEQTIARAIRFSIGIPDLMPYDSDATGELVGNTNLDYAEYFAESQGATSQAQPDFDITLSDYQAMSNSGSESGTKSWEAEQHGQHNINIEYTGGAELSLAAVATADLAIKYGKVLVDMYSSFKDKDARNELNEKILILNASSADTQRRIEILIQNWHVLDDEYRGQQSRALEVLVTKLQVAIAQLESVRRRKPRNNKRNVIEVIDKAIQDLENWRMIFDPAWFLILKAADFTIDQQLDKENDDKTEFGRIDGIAGAVIEEDETSMRIQNYLDSLGSELKNLKEHKEAVAKEKELGLEHSESLNSLVNLGLALARMEKYKEAETICGLLLEMEKRHLGPEHLDTLRVRAMQSFYGRMRRLEEAKELERQMMEKKSSKSERTTTIALPDLDRPLPSCPRSEPSAKYDDWYTVENIPDFDICPSCYEGVFASTPYAVYFKQPHRYGNRIERFCDFSNPWFRLAWLLTIKRKRSSLDLLFNLTTINEIEQPCPKDSKVSVNQITWYGIQDPRDGVHVANFAICLRDVEYIEALFPSMRGYFTRLLPVAQLDNKYLCSIRVTSRRFPRFIDLIVELDDESQLTGNSPDINRFVKLAQELAFKGECPRDEVLIGRPWHFIPEFPKFTVCEECFEDIIWPDIYKDPPSMIKRFNRKTQLVPGEDIGTSCCLYSPRMRRVWDRAVRNDDFDYLKRKVAERMLIKTELLNNRETILDLMKEMDSESSKFEHAKEQLKDMERRWREWE